MSQGPDGAGVGAAPDRRWIAAAVLVSVLLSVAAVWIFDRPFVDVSLFQLGNLVGPTTWSLLHGGGLTACTEAMGTAGNPICFHAGRMPLPSMVLAGGVLLLGDRWLPVAMLKALLLLLPIEAAISLVWRRMGASAGRRRWLIFLLLLLPFGMTPFLANVVNMQVEEGYSYSLLAMAVALLFFGRFGEREAGTGVGQAVLFAVAVDGLYLAKSSMILAAVVLTGAYVLRSRGVAARVAAVVLAVAAPVGWAMHQHHASGRYSLGTSIDGINLHKGNVATFLGRYPPPPGDSLDRYDGDLNAGRQFGDEWSFNDYHQRAAVAYMKEHPEATAEADLRKLEVILFSVEKYGSSASHGWMLALEEIGIVGFRLVFWGALGVSVAVLWRASAWGVGERWCAGIYLLLVGACVAPYLLGFAYTRHISVLIYPSVLLLARMLVGERRVAKDCL